MKQFEKLVVIGLGYIGLPTSAAFASAGVHVVGVDVNPHVVDTINRGEIHIEEPKLDKVVKRVVESGHLKASLTLQPADAFLIAVPTPFIGDDHEPDLSYIEAAARAISKVLKPGDLVILESTSPIGATEKLSAWLADERGDLSFPHKAGMKSDIRVAHCPERVLPGKVMEELVSNDRVIGGMTERCALASRALYQVFVKGDCILTDTRTAEMCKLTENAFRDVNIAYANELSIICEQQGIDVWELIRLANRHPRVNILQPGAGVGGHCIAVDPWFIVASASENAKLIRTAREVNDGKPEWIVNKVNSAAAQFTALHGGEGPIIAALGLSFKPDIDDLRESPALRIAQALHKAHGDRLIAVEPHISTAQELPGAHLTTLKDAIESANILVVLVRHTAFQALEYQRLGADQQIIDAVGILTGEEMPATFETSLQSNAATLQKKIDAAEQDTRRLAAHAAAMDKKILADERADRQRKTLSFRLGNIIIFGFKSWKGFRSLPVDLWKLRSEWKGRNKDELEEIFNALSPTVYSGSLNRKGNPENKKKGAHLELQDLIEYLKSLKELGMNAEALSICKYRFQLTKEIPLIKMGYWLAVKQKDKEFGKECLDFLSSLEDPKIKLWLKGKQKKLDPQALDIKELQELISDNGRGKRRPTPIKNSVCYCLHNSLPFTSGGYATRAHGVAQGLQKNDMKVICLTRPGFPNDTMKTPDTEHEEFHEIDGVQYFYTSEPSRRDFSSYAYIKLAAIAYEKQFVKHRPSSVMAASNHITAIPAMIAAKRLGIPFFYEVRGFWEITRISREPDFEKTKAFERQVERETFVAVNSDHVFTLTTPMKQELEKRGVTPHKITVVPNSCDPSRFVPRLRDQDLAKRYNISDNIPVIGYIGTFAQYEGLDDLVRACALIKKKGKKFTLLLVGNENTSGKERGPLSEEINRIADENDLMSHVIMPGRIPHEEVEAHYSLIDIAPFPRKSQPVTEMVSPMKPLEALAMEKAVVASSVKGMSELVQDGKTGLFFEKGNVEDLASTLEKLIDDAKMRARLGENGRKWVENERNWNKTTLSMYRKIKG